MAKTCPSCGYRPIGPFIDNCPICAEPVRNVRSDRAGFGRAGGMPPWVRWVIGGVVVAVVGAVGCCGVGMWRMGNMFQEAKDEWARVEAEREADRRARTVVVAAADLLKEFRDDPAAADQKYLGMYLEVTGVVERSGRGPDGLPFAILHEGGENVKLKIECFFYPMAGGEEVRIRRLNKGQTITVRGEYDGQVSNLKMRECVLVQPPAGDR